MQKLTIFILVTQPSSTSMAGMGNDGRHVWCQMDHLLEHSWQPSVTHQNQVTVLWTDKLPYNFRRYCMHMSYKPSLSIRRCNNNGEKDGYGEMSHVVYRHDPEMKNNATTSSDCSCKRFEKKLLLGLERLVATMCAKTTRYLTSIYPWQEIAANLNQLKLTLAYLTGW